MPELAQSDLVRLTGYLTPRLPGRLRGPLTARAITGGLSNLTDELRDIESQNVYVLRRPSAGVARTKQAADRIRREYQITRALHGTAVPVARPFLLCLDTSVIGAPFIVTAKAEGVILRTRELTAALTPQQRQAAATALIDTLAALHELDPRTYGLGEFSSPDAYLQRQLDRFDHQLPAASWRRFPALIALSSDLRRTVPEMPMPALLHGDYRFENIVYTEDRTGTITAVLDWEFAGLGDPLTDLGMLLAHWEEPATPAKPFTGGITNHPGFPTFRQIVDRYTAHTGLDISRLPWYLAFSYYKLIVISERIRFRHQRGLTGDAGYEEAGRAVPRLVELGVAALEADRDKSWPPDDPNPRPPGISHGE